MYEHISITRKKVCTHLNSMQTAITTEMKGLRSDLLDVARSQRTYLRTISEHSRRSQKIALSRLNIEKRVRGKDRARRLRAQRIARQKEAKQTFAQKTSEVISGGVVLV